MTLTCALFICWSRGKEQRGVNRTPILPCSTQLLDHSIDVVCSQREAPQVLSELLGSTCFYALSQVLAFKWLMGTQESWKPSGSEWGWTGAGWGVWAMEGTAQDPGPTAHTALENIALPFTQLHSLASTYFCTELSLPFLCPTSRDWY